MLLLSTYLFTHLFPLGPDHVARICCHSNGSKRWFEVSLFLLLLPYLLDDMHGPDHDMHVVNSAQNPWDFSVDDTRWHVSHKTVPAARVSPS